MNHIFVYITFDGFMWIFDDTSCEIVTTVLVMKDFLWQEI